MFKTLIHFSQLAGAVVWVTSIFMRSGLRGHRFESYTPPQYVWLAQLVEPVTVNHVVVGSSPTSDANDIIIMKQSIRILRGEIGILKRLLIFSLERACGFKSRRTQRADVQIGFSTPYQHSHYVISYHGNVPCCQTTSFRGVRCSPPFFSSDPHSYGWVCPVGEGSGL